MTLKQISYLFDRDLGRLAKEVSAFEVEENLWHLPNGISNTAGNLTLHLIGNLNHFIGAQLGNSGYVRNREAEFNDTSVPRAQILADIESTRSVVTEALTNLSPENLEEIYPIKVFGNEMKTSLFLIHLYGHLNYHLGQINYLRRMTEA